MSHTQSNLCTANKSAATRQFGLAALMLIMLWLAAGLGLARIVLALGILYYVATLPALARTCRRVRLGKRAGQPVSNAALVSTFLHSLKMVVLLATTSLAALLGACLVACVWCLLVATKASRLLARAFSGLAQPFDRLTRWTFSATRRVAAATLRGCSRRTFVLTAPWRMAALACSLVSAVVLLGSLVVVWTVRTGFDRFARMDRLTLFLRDRFVLWTTALVAADRQLLRTYQAVP
jgi:hypothetical protein